MYRTTRKSATQETPFALAFGTEVVAPVEVGIKSPRVDFTNAKHNEGSLRLNLNLLEEKREQALKRTEDYQRITTRYYDQKVRPNSFKPGDLVFKETNHFHHLGDIRSETIRTPNTNTKRGP